MSTIWHLMRAAAIERHRIINLCFERSCPIKWEEHMRIVRGFYGY